MNLLVFTDLDGTLLDHASYSCETPRPDWSIFAANRYH